MSKYLLWDIDEANLYYTFTKEELQNIDIIEMINLNIRGADSEYTLPLDIEAGKKITIINKDFGASATGNYYGIKLFLKSDPTEYRGTYWFFFQNQTATFFFNGTEWVMENPWPSNIPQISFIEHENPAIGYLDIMHSTDSIKKLLFSNINLDIDPIQYENHFFREGELNTFQKGGIKTHKHISNPHTHTYISISQDVKETKRGDTEWGGSDVKNVLLKGKNTKTTELLTVDISPEGLDKTEPKNISGRYIVKCW